MNNNTNTTNNNDLENLKNENKELKKEIEQFKKELCCVRLKHEIIPEKATSFKVTNENFHVSIIVIGASGDLAKKKTFPSLFSLYGLGLLPSHFIIYGFARTKMSLEEFRNKHIAPNCKGFEDKKDSFLSKCFYHCGQYNSENSFHELNVEIEKMTNQLIDNRIFYFSIPPNVFVDVARTIKKSSMSKNGWTRIVIEKPFGKDSESSAILSQELASLFDESQIYRIDHYLGKEMVQNIMITRFANAVWEPLWNRYYISCVLITFKEDIGIEGRGGYFDQYGIIRDVMQNHLLQILALVAMESPVNLKSEYIRDEKVKVLKSCNPIVLEDLVIGQYGRDQEGKQSSYLEDPTVSKDSITPTFATAVIHIHNPRWKGVPFILKCGKGLNERKAEIRIQFQDAPNCLFKNLARNELVIRVQPDEAVYMKFNAKDPGLESDGIREMELDLTYKKRFNVRLPDAYERLIYDVLRGDHNLFVRVDELEAAWKIFTPILHQIEREKIKPIIYPFGSRGPKESDELISRYGFIRSETYQWQPKL
jgi:glucose-6-phosphate 1-dehydrogenase